jgi:hypothetical protein
MRQTPSRRALRGGGGWQGTHRHPQHANDRIHFRNWAHHSVCKDLPGVAKLFGWPGSHPNGVLGHPDWEIYNDGVGG